MIEYTTDFIDKPIEVKLRIREHLACISCGIASILITIYDLGDEVIYLVLGLIFMWFAFTWLMRDYYVAYRTMEL